MVTCMDSCKERGFIQIYGTSKLLSPYFFLITRPHFEFFLLKPYWIATAWTHACIGTAETNYYGFFNIVEMRMMPLPTLGKKWTQTHRLPPSDDDVVTPLNALRQNLRTDHGSMEMGGGRRGPCQAPAAPRGSKWQSKRLRLLVPLHTISHSTWQGDSGVDLTRCLTRLDCVCVCVCVCAPSPTRKTILKQESLLSNPSPSPSFMVCVWIHWKESSFG